MLMDATVHVVDDDVGIRDALKWLLKSRGLDSKLYPNAEAFLEAFQPGEVSCILLDIRMGKLSGLELFKSIRSLDKAVPVIFLTAHGSIPTAVEVVKEGAADFFEKPFSDNLLVDRIYEVLNLAASASAQRARERDTRERYDSLSSREREVAALIVEGKLNKVIAHELAIAERTVEVHRSRIFTKMDVRSAVELTKTFSSVPGLNG